MEQDARNASITTLFLAHRSCSSLSRRCGRQKIFRYVFFCTLFFSWWNFLHVTSGCFWALLWRPYRYFWIPLSQLLWLVKDVLMDVDFYCHEWFSLLRNRVYILTSILKKGLYPEAYWQDATLPIDSDADDWEKGNLSEQLKPFNNFMRKIVMEEHRGFIGRKSHIALPRCGPLYDLPVNSNTMHALASLTAHWTNNDRLFRHTSHRTPNNYTFPDLYRTSYIKLFI